MSEIEIRVFPGASTYGATSEGHVVHMGTMHQKKTRVTDKGYLEVGLHMNGKNNSRQVAVAYVVCCSFHGPKPTDKHTVDHINRERTDNRPENLRWATMIEQASNRGIRVVHRRAHAPVSNDVIHQIDSVTGDVIRVFRTIQEAAIEIADPSKVKSAIAGISTAIRTSSTARGFNWTRVCARVADLEGEEWKPIPVSSTNAQVSSHGRVKRVVKSIGREEIMHCPILRPIGIRLGYYRISVGGRLNIVNTGVHQLVAEAFLGPCPDDAVVHHNDGDLLNNHKDNLSYKATKRHPQKRKREASEDEEEKEEKHENV